MHQLILHHPYRVQTPGIDISAHGNHGQPTAVATGSDGIATDSGFAQFNGNNSRVVVHRKPVWSDLVDLRIDCWLRLDEIGERQIIVEGAYSFSLYVTAGGLLAGVFLGLKEKDPVVPETPNVMVATIIGGGGSHDPFGTEAGVPPPPPIPPDTELDWIGVNSGAEYAPDGVDHKLPLDSWIKVSFRYNGASAWLFMDGENVGVNHELSGPVLDVQAAGVHIGGSPGGDMHMLHGAIDELKIWKFDPHRREKLFFCRDMPKETEICWRGLFGRIDQLSRDQEHREAMAELLACLAAAEEDFVRALYDTDHRTLRRIGRLNRRYAELWCAGEIAGPATADLGAEWGDLLKGQAGDPFWSYVKRVIDCVALLQELDIGFFLEELAECDDTIGAFLDQLNDGISDGLGLPRTKVPYPRPQMPSEPDYPTEPPATTPPDRGLETPYEGGSN